MTKGDPLKLNTGLWARFRRTDWYHSRLEDILPYECETTHEKNYVDFHHDAIPSCVTDALAILRGVPFYGSFWTYYADDCAFYAYRFASDGAHYRMCKSVEGCIVVWVDEATGVPIARELDDVAKFLEVFKAAEQLIADGEYPDAGGTEQ